MIELPNIVSSISLSMKSDVFIGELPLNKATILLPTNFIFPTLSLVSFPSSNSKYVFDFDWSKLSFPLNQF